MDSDSKVYCFCIHTSIKHIINELIYLTHYCMNFNRNLVSHKLDTFLFSFKFKFLSLSSKLLDLVDNTVLGIVSSCYFSSSLFVYSIFLVNTGYYIYTISFLQSFQA